MSEALYIVQKGAVKLGTRTNVGKELVLDMRSEGEVFGLLSLMVQSVNANSSGTSVSCRIS